MNERLELQLAAVLDTLAEAIARRVVELQAVSAVADDSSRGRSPWLSVDKAAAHLDWPKQRLYRLTASGEIPHYKQEGRLLFHRAELDEWLGRFAQGARETGSSAGGELFVRRR